MLNSLNTGQTATIDFFFFPFVCVSLFNNRMRGKKSNNSNNNNNNEQTNLHTATIKMKVTRNLKINIRKSGKTFSCDFQNAAKFHLIKMSWPKASQHQKSIYIASIRFFTFNFSRHSLCVDFCTVSISNIYIKLW